MRFSESTSNALSLSPLHHSNVIREQQMPILELLEITKSSLVNSANTHWFYLLHKTKAKCFRKLLVLTAIAYIAQYYALQDCTWKYLSEKCIHKIVTLQAFSLLFNPGRSPQVGMPYNVVQLIWLFILRNNADICLCKPLRIV